MTVYNFNGVTSGASTGNFVFGGDNPDLVNITYGEGFFTTNIRNEGTNVVIESSLGGVFVLQGVVIDQLTNANFAMNGDGTVSLGTNGFDWLFGNIVVAKGGPDWVFGTSDNDFLAGNAGDDWIVGGGGMDRIRGGQGDDRIEDFDSGSIVYGDKGADTIIAGTFVNDEDDNTGVTIFGGSGDPNDPLDGGDDITGSVYDDFIQGNGGADEIRGGAGDDVIRGGKDDDDLFGQDGKDWLRGDKGDDYVDGGRQGDELTGGEGKDIFGFNWQSGPNTQSLIGDVSVENIDEDGLNILPQNFGLTQIETMLDKITDLDVGDDGFHGVDQLYFNGWNSTGPDAGEVSLVENISANNMEDLLAAYYQEVGFDDDDQAVVIEVTGGSLAGKEFLFVSTDNDVGFQDPEYALQITGYHGTLDESDIIGVLPT